MNRHIGRIFLALFVAALLFIFIVIEIFGGSKKPAPNPSTPVVKSLPDYSSTTAQVSFTLDGPITGDDTHRQIKIIVDQFQRKLDIIGGYNGNIIQENNFANNQQAYDIFLRSLKNSGFMSKIKNPKITDERGQCPLGDRFIFELNDSGDVLSHSWTTSCGGTLGTLGVTSGTLQQLFKAQITNYDQIISKAKIDI